MKRLIRKEGPSPVKIRWKLLAKAWKSGLRTIRILYQDWQKAVVNRAKIIRTKPVIGKLKIYIWLSRSYPKLQWQIDRLIAACLIARDGIISAIYYARPGHLSWYLLVLLSARNLRSRWSRTVVTGGAISVGICAIVFLVSFGYGLQDIVTKRLVHPNSLKLIDVQSDSTALQLNSEAAAVMAKLPEVADVSKMVSLAGSFQMGTQKTEIVVVAVENKFMDYSYIPVVAGSVFSESGDAPYQATGTEVQHLMALATGYGEVAGKQDIKKDPVIGEKIDDRSIPFRISDETYTPVYAEPDISSPIIGYIRGSVVEHYAGLEVWGSAYQTSGTEGRAYRTQNGEWLGKWLSAQIPIWQESAPTIYLPSKEADGSQKQAAGFIPSGAAVKLSQAEATAAKLTDKVLGDSTDIKSTGTATTAAELKTLIAKETIQTATAAAQGGVVDVARQGGKEIIVSTGLLSLLKIDPNQALKQKASLTMIVSGGLIPGVAGRVLSNQVDYTIVGVVKDDQRPLVYVPLGDVVSMGVDRFSLIKVLASGEDTIKAVRERIETIGFMTQSLADTLVQVDRLFRVMRFLLGAIGMIALAVALLGMFNTLTVSLMERTREIGVMKTLGTTDKDVVRLYMVESVVLGLSGGFAGLSVGIILGETIDIIFRLIRGSLAVSMFRTPPGMFFLMMLISFIVGLTTGLLPAKRATKISALNALRYE